MNILYNVQVSNTTINRYKNPKWLLRNDACFNIAVGISECLLNLDKDLEITLKLPMLEDVYDIEDYLEISLYKNNPRLHIYEDKIPISPITSRFHFNLIQYSRYVDYFKRFDCMINDENTLTKNWRVFFNQIVKKDIPIISTNYFLDSPLANKVPEKIRYYERQMESFINSDIVAFQCDSSAREALEALSLMYKSHIVKKVRKKSSVWGVGAHAKEVREYVKIVNKSSLKPIIYFGNRITETVSRYTNWHIYSEAIGKVQEKCDHDFDAWVLNPTHKMTKKQYKEIVSLSNNKMKIINNKDKFTREDYLKFINHADIGVSLFTKEVHGGVTHCEALLANNILIAPNINNYAAKFGGTPYPFLCQINQNNNLTPNIDSLVEKIIYAINLWYIDRYQFQKWQEHCGAVGYTTESYEMASRRILDDIKKLVNSGDKK